MEIIKELLKTTKGKIIVFGGLITIIMIGVAVWFLTNRTAPNSDESITYLDDPSGAKLYTTNAETESESVELPLIIGFDIFFDFGFSANQQNKIYDTVHLYFLNNYPSVTRVSYIKDSFEYTSADESNESKFEIMADDNQKFIVNLNTNWSYLDIDISIQPLN